MYSRCTNACILRVQTTQVKKNCDKTKPEIYRIGENDYGKKSRRNNSSGSLFGITTLKDRLVAAQRITNMMLKHRTPVGFYPELSGKYEKSFHILENTEQVTAFLKENYANKYKLA